MRIKNWHEFQHFKDRNPVWIKLYMRILDDKKYHDLSGDDAKYLILLWLLGAEDKGQLPDNETTAFKIRYPEDQLESLYLRLNHWLEPDDNKLISDGYQNDALETETEGESERETENKSRCNRPKNSQSGKKLGHLIGAEIEASKRVLEKMVSEDGEQMKNLVLRLISVPDLNLDEKRILAYLLQARRAKGIKNRIAFAVKILKDPNYPAADSCLDDARKIVNKWESQSANSDLPDLSTDR